MIASGESTAPLWRLLSRFNPLQPRVLIAQLIFLLLTGFTYDIFQTEDWSVLFPIAVSASVLGYFLIFLTLQLFVRKIPPGSARAVLTALATTVALLTYSLVFLYLTKPESFLELALARFPSDITAALTIYWIMIGILTTGLEDLASSTEDVVRMRDALETHRNRRIGAATEFDSQLRKRVEDVLLTDLNQIASALHDFLGSRDLAKLSQRIHQIVENKVRPLSKELVTSTQQAIASNSAARLPIRKRSLPRARPSRDTQAWMLFLIAIPNFFATAWQNSDLFHAIAITAATLVIPLFNFLVGKLQRGREVALPIFWIMITVQTAIGFLPTIFVLGVFAPDYPELRMLTGAGLALLVIVNLMGATSAACFFAQKEQLDEARQLYEEIEHELSLIDQSFWMARRKWVYIIHGSVQSALTVAAAKLVSDQAGEMIAEARHSLESALESIRNPKQAVGGVLQRMEEIAETWRGVCDFEYRLAPSVVKLLDETEVQGTCLVEISKELVNNASRHGGATKIWLKAFPTSMGDIEVIAGNNGKPFPSHAAAGTGMVLFAELTKDFNFEKQKLGGFQATIPMPR